MLRKNEVLAVRKRDCEIVKSGVAIHILRSKRKSVVARVLPDGCVEVRAPFSMSNAQIDALLDKFEAKLRPSIEEHRKITEYIAEHPFGYGGEVLFMGEWTSISEAPVSNDGAAVVFTDSEIIVRSGLTDIEVRIHIERLFSSLAVAVFEAKLNHYASKMGVRYSAWSVGSARKRHGSCDSNGKIILSWRIIMMSDDVIDYIVVHELAHLKHLNHSRAFHDEVALTLPDWKERRAAHRRYSDVLRCGGWL